MPQKPTDQNTKEMGTWALRNGPCGGAETNKQILESPPHLTHSPLTKRNLFHGAVGRRDRTFLSFGAGNRHLKEITAGAIEPSHECICNLSKALLHKRKQIPFWSFADNAFLIVVEPAGKWISSRKTGSTIESSGII